MSQPLSSDADRLGYPTRIPSASASPQMDMSPLHPSVTSASPQISKHPSSPNPRPTRKRPVASRPIIACEECRRRKIGCSRSQPCNSCVRLKRSCIFLNQELHSSPRQDPKSSSGRPLESRKESPHTEAPESSQPGGNLDRPSLYQPGGLTSVRHMDGAHGEASAPAAADLYLRIGRMSVTERIGDASRQDMVNIVGADRVPARFA